MGFREYIATIGMKEMNPGEIEAEAKKLIESLNPESRKDLKNRIDLFEESNTKNWMKHLNSPFASLYDICFSGSDHIKEYEGVAKIAERGTKKKYIVDVGAGTGILTNYVALWNPYKTVVALDVSEGALRESKRKRDVMGLDNVEFVVCDARYMPLVSGLNAQICLTRLSERNLPKSEYSEIEKEVKRIS